MMVCLVELGILDRHKHVKRETTFQKRPQIDICATRFLVPHNLDTFIVPLVSYKASSERE